MCNQSMRSRDGCAESVLDFISITPDITDGTYVQNISAGNTQIFMDVKNMLKAIKKYSHTRFFFYLCTND